MPAVEAIYRSPTREWWRVLAIKSLVFLGVTAVIGATGYIIAIHAGYHSLAESWSSVLAAFVLGWCAVGLWQNVAFVHSEVSA